MPGKGIASRLCHCTPADVLQAFRAWADLLATPLKPCHPALV